MMAMTPEELKMLAALLDELGRCREALERLSPGHGAGRDCVPCVHEEPDGVTKGRMG